MSTKTWETLAAAAAAKVKTLKADASAIEAQILRDEQVKNLFSKAVSRGWTEMATSSITASVEGGLYRPERRGMSAIIC